ncbi:uncharacterized protein [Watersipora subatra]|uniref:uncharacterized protein n=1 Tax=Watersipora subatra TaxID=2589382 RepID=UPI00355B6175
MTLFDRYVGNTYPIAEVEDVSRPQIVSRHSSSLPVDYKSEAKVLSRRSRSASPCIKKNYSLASGNTAEKRKIAKEALTHSVQLPVIKKQASQTLGRNFRAPRSSLVHTRQRVQVFNDHKRLKSPPHVWEHISVTRNGGLADINSNLSYQDNKEHCGRSITFYTHNQTAPQFSWDRTFSVIKHQKVHSSTTTSLFDCLPNECVLKIFSYLNQIEKGKCMLVSKLWYCMLRVPCLWRNVNLREFVLCYGHANYYPSESGELNSDEDLCKFQCNKQCYDRYMTRIDRYILFLIDVKAKVRRISISFDLANEYWMGLIKDLFRGVDFGQLTYADIDWHVTPVKPLWLTEGTTCRYNDFLHATRRRERYFLNFLEEFVEEMPNLKSLIVPFSWSERVIKYLGMLPNLHCLALKQYSVIRNPSQEVFDNIAKMNSLEKLLIEVWVSSSNHSTYHIASPSLKYLDLSQCRGFHLQSVNLPSLEILKVERLNGASQNNPSVPCLYDILRVGAPKLARINNCTLSSMTDVDDVINRVCSCKRHYPG